MTLYIVFKTEDEVRTVYEVYFRNQEDAEQEARRKNRVYGKMGYVARFEVEVWRTAD